MKKVLKTERKCKWHFDSCIHKYAKSEWSICLEGKCWYQAGYFSSNVSLIQKVKARIKSVCIAPYLRTCVFNSGLDGHEWSDLFSQKFYYHIQVVQGSDQTWVVPTFAKRLMNKVTEVIIMNYENLEMICSQDLWSSTQAIYFHTEYLSYIHTVQTFLPSSCYLHIIF